MAPRLTATLRAAPATIPAAAALVVLVVWSGEQAGYPLTHWAPGAILILGLLGITGLAVGVREQRPARLTAVAIACLAAFAALSFLSILWARSPGDAWEGADRTLLYLLVFVMFAAWRQRGASAAALLLGWTLALGALALHAALQLATAAGGSLQSMFAGGRLVYPSGYANANAAEWLMAFWPALMLARGPRLHWAVRGLLAGLAVLLADVALLSQSRGSLYATPVMVVLVLALLPGRLRTFAALVPIAAAVGASAPSVLKVGNHLHGDSVEAGNVHTALAAMAVAALACALVVGAGAALDAGHRLSPSARGRLRRGLAALAIAALVAVLAGGLVAAGDPVARVRSAWHSFKGGYANGSGSDRLVSGLGSNRYDFYRVAVDEFEAHPVLGIGADNFQQQYLRHGRSDETPRYPHSVELRTLLDTGSIGGLLAVVGLAAALLAASRAARGPDALGRTVAAAALSGFGYWVVHGSFDWFWEFAGLGAPAFALLGIACGLAPGRERDANALPPSRRRRAVPGSRARTRRLAAAPAALAALAALAAAGSLALPWLSELQVEQAARVWTRAPGSAYAELDESASLDPLSDQPYLVAGSIALRRGETARADGQFALALGRSPDDSYAVLERGAIASQEGRRGPALALLERAVALEPRDPLAHAALAVARSGKRVSVTAVNRAILLRALQLS